MVFFLEVFFVVSGNHLADVFIGFLFVRENVVPFSKSSDFVFPQLYAKEAQHIGYPRFFLKDDILITIAARALARKRLLVFREDTLNVPYALLL